MGPESSTHCSALIGHFFENSETVLREHAITKLRNGGQTVDSEKEEKYRHYAEKIRIFNGLSAEEVRSIIHQGETLNYPKGKTVFHEGMLGSNLFIVLSGEVGIFRKGTLIAKLCVGEAFGEMAVLNQTPRSATVTATKETKLFTLNESQIDDILEKRAANRVLLNIIHVLSERLEDANAWITDQRKGR